MKRSELIKDVSQKLRGLSQTGPLVVGVDGPDCSGKTMFSGEIENALVGEGRKVLVLHVDDFCYFPGSKPVKGNPVSLAEDFLYNTINFMKISEEILGPLKKMGSLKWSGTVLNNLTNKFEKDLVFEIDRETIFLVEGIFLYKDLTDFIDYRIRLEVSGETQVERAIKRDFIRREQSQNQVIEKYSKKYQPGQQLYRERYLSKAQIDFSFFNDNIDYPEMF